MVWACPNLRGFWSAVFKLIARVTGVITKPTIEKAILCVNMSEYPIQVKSIAMHILFVARSLIVSNWKPNAIPSVRKLILKVNTIAEYEKILAVRDGSMSR